MRVASPESAAADMVLIQATDATDKSVNRNDFAADVIGTGRTFIVRTKQISTDIAAVAGTCYYIAPSSLTADISIDVGSLSEEADYIEVANFEETYRVLVDGGTVYYASGETMDAFSSFQNTPVRNIRTILRVI